MPLAHSQTANSVKMRIYIEAPTNDRYLTLEEKDGHELVFASDEKSLPNQDALVAVLFATLEGSTTVVSGPLPAKRKRDGREFITRRDAIDYCIREFLYD